MNMQTVQPASTPNGQTQQPTLQSLSEPSLFNADPSDLDFRFDEASGQFMMDFKAKPQATQPSDTAVTEPNPQQQSPTNEPDKYDARFQTIEQAIIRMAGMFEGMQASNNQNQQTQQTENKQQVNLDPQSDDFTANLVNIITQAIERKFEEKMKPINQNMGVVNDRMLLTDLALKYGTAFTDLMPAMTEYKKSDPAANWETLYLAMSKIPRGKQDSTTQTTNGSVQNAQPQVDLAQRAQQLSTVRNGISPSVVSDTPKGKQTIAQIVEQSIQELTGR